VDFHTQSKKISARLCWYGMRRRMTSSTSSRS
jgi:hypothetical protein